MSPPSRAAWIEILEQLAKTGAGDSRRLHGRRGLKYGLLSSYGLIRRVAAFTGGVD